MPVPQRPLFPPAISLQPRTPHDSISFDCSRTQHLNRSPAMSSPSGKGAGSTPPSLLQRALEKDAEAWRNLLAWARATVLDCCRRAGLQNADYQEVSQEVSLRVSKNLAAFVRRTSFRAWVRAITHNCINDLFRSRAQGNKVLAEYLAQQPPTVGTDPSSDADDRESAAQLLVEQMKAAHGNDPAFQAFLRITIGQESSADVARDLGVGHARVRQWISRMAKRLRQDYKDTFDDLFPPDPSKRPNWPL